MISINKQQCQEPIDPDPKRHILANKQVVFLAGEREYLIDHDMERVVRTHPKGHVFAKAIEATGKLFSEGHSRSTAKHLTCELFNAPTDRQKQLQGPASSSADV